MDDTAGRGPVRWRRTLVLLLGLPGLLLSVLLLLVVVGILLRNRIVNSAPIRKEISFALYQFTGRDITLQGEIEIEDFPWVTVVVGPGTFGNPPDFTGPPLLSWRQIRLRVHYSTLYERAPLLDRITVTGLVADLRRDRDGRDNFSDIGPVESSGPPEAALSMPVIELRDASLRYTDETRSTEPLIALDALSLGIEKISRGAGATEGPHWQVGALSLTSKAKITLPAASASQLRPKENSPSTPILSSGSLEIQARGLDARVPEEADSSIDVAVIELGFDALRAKIDTLAFRPPTLAAAVSLDPIALDQLLRVVGVEPSFRSTADALQLHELTMQARFDGKLLHLADLASKIDETRIRGDLILDDPLRVRLDIDRVDLEKYVAAFDRESDYDPEVPLAFPGRLLKDLPLDGRIHFGKISARGANLKGVTLRLESRPKGASPPR